MKPWHLTTHFMFISATAISLQNHDFELNPYHQHVCRERGREKEREEDRKIVIRVIVDRAVQRRKW